MGQTEGRVELAEPPVVATLRLVDDPGTDLEVDFELVWHGAGPAYIHVTADRMRGRFADYELTATLDGAPLADPHDGSPFMGGPATVVRLMVGEPFVQTLRLADYVALPAAASGLLELRCRRAISLGATPEAAQVTEPTTVEVTLSLLLGHHPPGTMGR